MPETQYTITEDGLAIAYQTVGDGPTDVVLVPAHHSVDAMWGDPVFDHGLARLARLGRLILLDYRGHGSSDPVPLGALPTPEVWTDDLRSVLDAVGSSSCHIVQHGGGEFLGMLFAATYPERVKTLTLYNSTARVARADDYLIGVPRSVLDRFIDFEVRAWGTRAAGSLMAPSRGRDETFLTWYARYQRGSLSPGVHRAFFPWVMSLDMRAILPYIRVPTLILHRTGNVLIRTSHAEYLAAHIPDAKLIEVEGEDFWMFSERVDECLDHVEGFITGMPAAADPDRALATVMFTDIVGSTEQAARLGDHRWRQLLDRHDEVVFRELIRHRGRKINSTGDGVLATFDGPARAVRCAEAIREGVRALGLEIRAGIHVGEIEYRGADVGGIAVHIGARVAAEAGAGEILVSRTVTDLVVGSGLRFEDRGEHHLKGIDAPWQLFSACAS